MHLLVCASHQGPRTLGQVQMVVARQVLNLSLSIRRTELLGHPVLDPLYNLPRKIMHPLGHTITLGKNTAVLRSMEKQTYVNPRPSVDRLIVVPCQNNTATILRDLSHHGPLQRREILCLIHNKQIQIWRLNHLDILIDLIHKIHLVHARLVVFQRSIEPFQLSKVQRITAMLVVLLLQGNHPVPCSHLKLRIQVALFQTRRNGKPIIH